MMNEFEIWRRTPSSDRCRAVDGPGRQLIVPAIEAVGELPYELAGLLPNREHSRDLTLLIDSLPDNDAGGRCVVGLFAADPFLNAKRIADCLCAKGYRQVATMPPVAAYGAAFLETLDDVAAGQAQEQRTLEQLAAHGLSVSPAVAAVEGLPAALAWRPERLWVVPSFDIWQGTAVDANRLLSLCRAVVRRTDVPVILSAAAEALSPREAAAAGAAGILLDD